MPKQRTVAGAPTSPSTHSRDRRRRTTGAIAKAVNANRGAVAAKRAQLVRAGEHGSFSDDRDTWDESGPSAAYVFLYGA